MVETYSQEIGLELDGPGQVRQGRFGLAHGQEDGGSLVEGQVVLRVSLCEAQSPESRHFPFGELHGCQALLGQRHKCQRVWTCVILPTAEW